MLEQKYIDVLEKMDWRVVAYSDDGSEVDIESFSPAGEDIVFSVSKKDFPRAVKEYACDFDPDEHVQMWAEAKINGRQGIPSIRELVFDADNIENMLSSLAMEQEGERMNDYIRRKDVLAVLNGLFQDIIDNHQIGNGKNDYKDGIFHGEKACVIEAALRIKKLPAADVKPVVRGEWYNGDRNEGAQKTKLNQDGTVTDTAYCSVCGDWLTGSDEYAAKGRFCPNCGADMRGEEEK